MKSRSPYTFRPHPPVDDWAGLFVALLIVALLIVSMVALWASEAVFGG